MRVGEPYVAGGVDAIFCRAANRSVRELQLNVLVLRLDTGRAALDADAVELDVRAGRVGIDVDDERGSVFRRRDGYAVGFHVGRNARRVGRRVGDVGDTHEVLDRDLAQLFVEFDRVVFDAE